MNRSWRWLRSARALLGAAPALAAAACVFFAAPERVDVVVEGIPPAWTALGLEWTLEVDGRPVADGPEARFGLELVPGEASVVLVRPSVRGRPLEPFGARVPASAAAGGAAVLVCTPGGGFEGELALRLAAAGIDWRRFDFGRFGAELAARIADPWELDPARLAAAIACGNFRASLLDPPDRFRVSIACPEGTLVPASPFAPSVALAGGVAELELGPGTRSFFGASGSVEVSVDGRGRATALYRLYE